MEKYEVLVVVNICNAVLTSLAVCQSIYYMNLRQNLAYDGDEAAAKRIILPIYKPVLIGISILYIVFALCLGLTLIDPNWENKTYFKILQYFQFTCIFLYTIIPTLLLQPSVSYKAFRNVAFMLLPWWLITTVFWLATFVGNYLEIIFQLIFILSASILPGLLSISILTRVFKSRVEILSTSNRNAMEFLLLYCVIFCSLYSVCLFYDKNFNSLVTYNISLAITICSCVFNQLFPFALYRTLLADTKFWRGLGSHNKGIKVSSENNINGDTDDDMNIHRPVNLNLAIASSTFQSMMIDMGDLLIDFAMLEINTQIGKGATSQVYRGKYRKKIVAIKLSTPPEITQEVIHSFTTEAKIAASLKHPNIVHFIGICVRPPQIAMVLEYCEGGNLKHNLLIHHKEWTNLKRLKACLDACKAIECLHQHKIIHRDLKAENFFVGRKQVVKLGDFGESTKFRTQESTVSKRMTILGTVAFMAPELIDAKKYYTEAVDIYALAITMWEIWTGEDILIKNFVLKYIISIYNTCIIIYIQVFTYILYTYILSI